MPGFDMHIHTTASDGMLKPREIITAALAKGLDGIAITDHDTVEALTEGVKLAAEAGMPLIPGIEFSTVWREYSVHILAYWIDYQDASFREYLDSLQEDRRMRCRRMADKLAHFGMPIDIDKMIEQNGQSIGRPHLAQALVASGYVESTREAFQKWLAKGAPAYVPRSPHSPFDVIEKTKCYGGAAVLAHPGMGVPDQLTEQLAMHGLDGIEVYHPEHDRRMGQKYLRIAKFYHLAVTGGSDFHGTRGDSIGSKTTALSQVELLARKRQGIK